ncbi:hypothetical protein FB451DRAFT_1375583 [Mycena latifolia]|nr:hypothetical protein FB451DRAFT_1375583 [Mycena latifolia]
MPRLCHSAAAPAHCGIRGRRRCPDACTFCRHALTLAPAALILLKFFMHARQDARSDAPDLAPETSDLWCGTGIEVRAEQDNWWNAHRPRSIPFLPLPLDFFPALTPPRPPKRKSSGCGAPVHTSANPAREGLHWVGCVEDAELTVIPLEPEYFAEPQRMALEHGRRRCGCAVDGVGCAICCLTVDPLAFPPRPIPITDGARDPDPGCVMVLAWEWSLMSVTTCKPAPHVYPLPHTETQHIDAGTQHSEPEHEGTVTPNHEASDSPPAPLLQARGAFANDPRATSAVGGVPHRTQYEARRPENEAQAELRDDDRMDLNENEHLQGRRARLMPPASLRMLLTACADLHSPAAISTPFLAMPEAEAPTPLSESTPSGAAGPSRVVRFPSVDDQEGKLTASARVVLGRSSHLRREENEEAVRDAVLEPQPGVRMLSLSVMAALREAGAAAGDAMDVDAESESGSDTPHEEDGHDPTVGSLAAVFSSPDGAATLLVNIRRASEDDPAAVSAPYPNPNLVEASPAGTGIQGDSERDPTLDGKATLALRAPVTSVLAEWRRFTSELAGQGCLELAPHSPPGTSILPDDASSR